MQTTISSRGQTAVPAEVRRRFHLKANSKLEWMIEGHVITVLPVPPDTIHAFRGSLAEKYSGKTLLRDRHRDRQREKMKA